MICHYRLIYISLSLLALFHLVACEAKERRCFSTEPGQCWQGETCRIQKTANPISPSEGDGICVCLRGYQKVDNGDNCLPVKATPLPTPAKVNSDSKSSSASIAAGILVPLLFVGVAVLIVLARRYGWWERLRRPHIRHYDTALVGGDLEDDPPIA